MKQDMLGVGSSISWTICKLFVLHSRQITIPAPYHTITQFLHAGGLLCDPSLS